VVITIGPSIIESKDELKEEIETKTNKIRSLENELNKKDTKIREERKSCTNQILEREKEFVTMLDYLKDKAKKEDNKILSQMNMETLKKVDSSATSVRNTSTVIIKNDMKNIISEIEEIKRKLKK
jgi:hypothetical protein